MATCASAGEGRLAGRLYRMLVIDEATQATEPTTLIPLVRPLRTPLVRLLPGSAGKKRIQHLQHPCSVLQTNPESSFHRITTRFCICCWLSGTAEAAGPQQQQQHHLTSAGPLWWPPHQIFSGVWLKGAEVRRVVNRR